MTDWIAVEDRVPEIGQRVEYYFAPKPDFVIQGEGTFQGYYTDSEGVEWKVCISLCPAIIQAG